MVKNISIQLKASLLLFVFSMNMFIGFACAIGLNINFNNNNHQIAESGVHIHTNGKKHHHNEAEHKHSGNNKKGDCCNDKVIKLSQTDKAVPFPYLIISPVFFTSFITSYYSCAISFPSQISIANKFYVRGHHPPIANILIAIQRFQI